jgi:hypothetical protein
MTKKDEKYLIDESYLNIEIGLALKNNDYDRIKTILLPESYPNLSIIQKEEKIFELALSYLYFNLTSIEFFKYFIFEHKVSQDIYNKMEYAYKSKVVEDMFESRNLNENLNLDLNTNDKIGKKLKV